MSIKSKVFSSIVDALSRSLTEGIESAPVPVVVRILSNMVCNFNNIPITKAVVLEQRLEGVIDVFVKENEQGGNDEQEGE